MSRTTKQGSLSGDFNRKAAIDPMGGLATMFLAAFGVGLAELMDIALAAITSKDINIILMALTAGVQIRAHVVFVGRDFGNIRTKYPQLVIDGGRPQQDIFNFGALHALGHVFAHLTSNGLKVVQKAGSCITGEYVTDSEAGKINREIFNSWSSSDRAEWSAWLATNRTAGGPAVDSVLDNIPRLAGKFKTVGGAASGADVKG